MLIKNNLYKMRTSKGASQAETARTFGMSQGSYSMIETGRSVMSRQELYKICEAYECSPEQIYTAEILAVVFGIETERKEKKRRPSFSVRLPEALGDEIDTRLAVLGYANRTEYVVDTVRRRISGC